MCCNFFHAVTSQIILIYISSSVVYIDSTQDGLPSVFQILGLIYVFFYSLSNRACFL